MSEDRNIVWILKHQHEKYGDALFRLGLDSENNIVLRITTCRDGVEHSTFKENISVDFLTGKSKEEIEQLINEHLNVFYKSSVLPTLTGFEKDWFTLIPNSSFGDCLVEYNYIDNHVIVIIFDQKDHEFWSAKIYDEHLYDLDLDEYSEDFEKLEKDMSPEILSKLFKKGLTEEDWII